MMQRKLTSCGRAARSWAMNDEIRRSGRDNRLAWGKLSMLGLVTALVAGCISVNAPDKPIVIELNINIRQEVIYRIADDVANTIDDNPEIF